MSTVYSGSKNPNYKHGLSKHPLHRIWRSFKARCYDKNKKDYFYYGARGIKVCDEWLINFKSFYDWAITNGYKKGLELDRINNDGNYSPDNCRWATHSENVLNCTHLRSHNTSGFKGIVFRDNKWYSGCTVNGKRHNLGVFKTKELAALAYNNFMIENKIKTSLNIV